MTYRAKEFRPGIWHVIDSTGQPIYDGAPDGNDSAAVFFDPDAADECAARLNRDAQSAETKMGTIHLRVPMERKNAYVQAAKPGKLTAWICSQLDKASNEA